MSVCGGLKHRAWEKSNNQFNYDAVYRETYINFHEASAGRSYQESELALCRDDIRH